MHFIELVMLPFSLVLPLLSKCSLFFISFSLAKIQSIQSNDTSHTYNENLIVKNVKKNLIYIFEKIAVFLCVVVVVVSSFLLFLPHVIRGLWPLSRKCWSDGT